DIRLPANTKAKAGLNLKISTTGKQALNEILMDSLTIYLSGHSGRAQRIYEQLYGNACAVILRHKDQGSESSQVLPLDSIVQVGFSDGESLFPSDDRTFSGFRLLREYF